MPEPDGALFVAQPFPRAAVRDGVLQNAQIQPELLAALAQVEGAGNPVARTYWWWHLTWDPFAL